MTQELDTGGLKCQIFKYEGATDIVYLLYPMNILKIWCGDAVQRYKTNMVIITGMDWDNDLTPWTSTGEPPGSPDFGGLAPQFLQRIRKVCQQIERMLDLTVDPERTLIGVSLSGLFTLWQWAECDFFKNIISLSGSFWFPGFLKWIESKDFRDKSGFAYFLLGNKEAATNIVAFMPVEKNTHAIVQFLQQQNVNAHLEMVPGNHYQYPLPRLEHAMDFYLRVKSIHT